MRLSDSQTMRLLDRQTKEDCGKMKDIVAGCFSFQKTNTLERSRPDSYRDRDYENTHT